MTKDTNGRDAVSVRDLTFSYDGETDVLKGISFDIPQGSYTAVIGHNGSGKSTLAKLLIGLLAAKSGTIRILGQELNEETVYDIRNRTGIVFQNPDNQFIGSTVADDIAFGLENRCIPQNEMQGLIETAAAQVGMTKFLESEPTKLSGGQKQRVAIAGILAVAPDIIIFDESTSMLDPRGKKAINEEIRRLHEERDITILSITHDMEEVAQSDNVLVLRDGTIAMTGTPREVFSRERELKEMDLDVPFAWKITEELMKLGLADHPALNLEEAAEELCR
ncbi:energy-coupling factor transporter ATPase [Faecalibaculum rodentium]|jgi:energy-coupling factor transport system ATP-binding protein|uniref:Cobalt ABC transporter ATP-binding protein n=1 Tax=Faecalibaculum rodentium TaxID=1702221 RepID=A0A140DSI2_9FIRM|nr:energy-coupling factor transporter ATPase [Faecalibaculum rodentium]AMK53609.1 cobalt ABC transporter ATP-binding protein [Faecalibaculum rodentium]